MRRVATSGGERHDRNANLAGSAAKRRTGVPPGSSCRSDQYRRAASKRCATSRYKRWRCEGIARSDLICLDRLALLRKLNATAGVLSGGTAPANAPPTLATLGGLPTRDEMVRQYASGSTRDVSAVTWYEVLACFKLGIVLEGTHARAYAGLAPRETGDRLHATTMALFARAHTLIANG